MQTEGKINNNKKKTRIKSGSNEDLGVFVRVPVIFLYKIPKTQTKRRFLALVKHYIINLEFLNSPSFPQGPELIVILCIFVYASAILNFVYAIRSGTDQLLQRISFILFSSTVLITFKPPHVLAASNVLGIVRNTRQAKHDSTTTGQAKLVGIEPSL